MIDVHLHALPADAQGPPPLGLCPSPEEGPYWDPRRSWPEAFVARAKSPPCAEAVWSPETDAEVRDRTLEILRRRNVVGVLSGTPERVAEWKAMAPERIIEGVLFQLGEGAMTPEEIADRYRSGQLRVLGEVTNQYLGVSPSDPEFEPYLAVAEELDIPVGIHIGPGPPGAHYLGFERFRAALHSPLHLEEALIRHPRLRVYVMHAGWPMIDDMLAVLWNHPHVYVGTGVLVWSLPREGFYRYLRELVDAGFGKRVMFGSDQMVWPEMIEHGIDVIESAPFLSERQKRDILYHNAARFLRLGDGGAGARSR